MRKWLRWLHQDERGELGPPESQGPRDNDPGRGDSGATPGTGVFTSDPLNQYSGMVWIRSDTIPTPELRVNINGAVYRVPLS